MDQKATRKAILLIEEFRKLDPKMPIQMAHILLLVALKPGVNMRQLMADTDLSKSSVTRHVEVLGDGGKTGPGLGLVVSRDSLEDRRFKEVRLTPAGERVIRSIIHYTGGE
ncbi:DNA-binding transcriptional regulator, MarR family [Chelatococcus sambhunathii]|uniref:DNA-binding transcriptional regulator, MarR family n=1 Tax=Chelatococcus sambhunathii TaxID=363953 RepID=A0ABP2AEQ8_9HYPH|nr:MarR family winged helix-turn-helix transcriptional regulator [Chelatococcus sambhunathii]CUA90958.1 DNA-binding transcriptional regulator, MarR family [Chelatococcus sambhunathii]